MTTRDRLSVALVAGEASGDRLGAGLLRALRSIEPATEAYGIGGPQIAAERCEILEPAESLAVMGLAEVVRHLPRLKKIQRTVRRHFLDRRPNIFVGIDSPDFNLRLARPLHDAGIPTVQYVSPSVWAWRRGRIKTIKRAVDHVLCLLPFEPDFYSEHGVSAEFVGHPLADELPETRDTRPARLLLGLDPALPTVAVLPGSRVTEIEALGEDFACTIAAIVQERPNCQFVAPMVTPHLRAMFEGQVRRFARGANVAFTDGEARTAMTAADVVLLASGTAALEAMLIGRPMVVAYRLSRVSRWVVETFGLLHVHRFSLPNILAERDLVPELMQDAATPPRLAAAVTSQLENPHREALLAAYRRLRSRLAGHADQRAAEAVIRVARRG